MSLSERQEKPEGILNDLDRRIIKGEAGRNLVKLIDKQDFGTQIFVLKGGYIFKPLVDGICEGLKKTGAKSKYFKCSRVNDEKKQITENLIDLVKRTDPPFLLVDDMMSYQHNTFNVLAQGMKMGLDEKYGKNGYEMKNMVWFFPMLANIDQGRIDELSKYTGINIVPGEMISGNIKDFTMTKSEYYFRMTGDEEYRGEIFSELNGIGKDLAKKTRMQFL